MKIVLAVAAVLLVTACGSEAVDSTPIDSGGSSIAMPTEVPAAPGDVRSRNIVTVMDTGSPELCLGPVAESWPPQCSGPAIAGWNWADHRGTFESQQDIRWGMYAVAGTWDGEVFTVTEAIPAALYDPMPQPEPTYPTPPTEYSDDELADIAEEVGELPGAQSFYPDDAGHVLVDVIYDDGSLQAWADDEYGDGVVVVTSALVDA